MYDKVLFLYCNYGEILALNNVFYESSLCVCVLL